MILHRPLMISIPFSDARVDAIADLCIQFGWNEATVCDHIRDEICTTLSNQQFEAWDFEATEQVISAVRERIIEKVLP